jgi:hypothetical protein
MDLSLSSLQVLLMIGRKTVFSSISAIVLKFSKAERVNQNLLLATNCYSFTNNSK